MQSSSFKNFPYLSAAYTYSDFGETEEVTGSSFDNEICYTGQIYDDETGLYYYNARYYDPANGRFISQDTYRGETDDPGTWHLYAYCANNPINYVDPSGHKHNINKSTTHWWGRTNYLSYKNAKELRADLKKYEDTYDVIATIVSAEGLFNVYLGAFSFVNTVLSKYVSYFRKRIKECNKKGKGIKYKIYWLMNYKMRTQGKK